MFQYNLSDGVGDYSLTCSDAAADREAFQLASKDVKLPELEPCFVLEDVACLGQFVCSSVLGITCKDVAIMNIMNICIQVQ